jgi:hypothetical protein
VTGTDAYVEPALSPDGRWLAYATNQTGRIEVFVQPNPPTGGKRQVSTSGGRQPQWRADGRELFFVSDTRKFFAVDVRESPGRIDLGTPHPLFDLPAMVNAVRNSYSPSRDGRRFLVNELLARAPSPIDVVVNWTSTLLRTP